MARHDRAGILETGVAFDAAFSQVTQHAHKAANQAEPERLGKFRFKPGINVNNPQMAIEPTMPAKKPSQLFFGLTRGAILCLPILLPTR